MIEANASQAESRIPSRITTRVLLPEPVWKEFESIALLHKVEMPEYLSQSIYWSSSPYRSKPPMIADLAFIEMPGHSGDGWRSYDVNLSDPVYFEIEDLARMRHVDLSYLMTQFLLHAVFDGPLADTLEHLTGEDRVRRQPAWKASLRKAMQVEGGVV